MKREEKKKWVEIDKEVKFSCLNQNLIGISGIKNRWADKVLSTWCIYDTNWDYIDNVDNSIGKMYSLSWGEVSSFEALIEIWKQRYIIDGFTTTMSKKFNHYGMNCYDLDSKESFDKRMVDLAWLLNKGCTVHYSEENGVGDFHKEGKKYILSHHRWGTTNTQEGTIQDIADFIRNFFSIGMTLQEDW